LADATEFGEYLRNELDVNPGKDDRNDLSIAACIVESAGLPITAE
jgi:hypothetical protein